MKIYDTLNDYIESITNCVFCGSKLKCRLINYAGGASDSIPIINATLKNNLFVFDIKRTTPNFAIEVRAIIDVMTNIIEFKIDNTSPTISTVLDTFANIKPLVELYCPAPYRHCKYKYSASSGILTCYTNDNHERKLSPICFYNESFITGNLWVLNDYTSQQTHIHSRVNEISKPISVPLLNFGIMGAEKILNRIETLVVFS